MGDERKLMDLEGVRAARAERAIALFEIDGLDRHSPGKGRSQQQAARRDGEAATHLDSDDLVIAGTQFQRKRAVRRWQMAHGKARTGGNPFPG